ncbi:MAG TPA: hypothetical protein VFS11_05520, partial [Gemmatimonadales bacterium]|nr:hypothetical protein [Gemmatimonadales bacterium]
RRVRFEPRASLGPEVFGRCRRGEQSKGAAQQRRRRPALWLSSGIAALGALAAAGIRTYDRPLPAAALQAEGGSSSTAPPPREVRVDRCCFDLDGGGRADDGIAVILDGTQQAAIRRIDVYEDRDKSKSFTDGDLVRFTRGPRLIVDSPLPANLLARHFCCGDYDGDGTVDEGVLVVSRPPDRVVLVGLYNQSRRETHSQSGDETHSAGFLLR